MDDEIDRFLGNVEAHLSAIDDLDELAEGKVMSVREWADLDLGEDIVLAAPGSEIKEEVINDEYMDLVREMEVGDWLEFIDEEGGIKRAKLEWKGDIIGEYLFVNWRYQVVAERTMAGLAAELRSSKARFVDDLPIFDKALSRVMDALIRATKKTAH
ncbi:MAG: hypothetical protein A2V90_08595 [Gammaproteobacteria bacterium RBG_16_57_12]|nr:MAG: hypothetical protein A2V90_08595 [Gammaproteobacteria bacterium RBG_16_57_12]